MINWFETLAGQTGDFLKNYPSIHVGNLYFYNMLFSEKKVFAVKTKANKRVITDGFAWTQKNIRSSFGVNWIELN